MRITLVLQTLKTRLLAIAIALDAFLFCLVCLGRTRRGETASAAAWVLDQDGKWQGKLFRPLIDWLFSPFEERHCAHAWLSEQYLYDARKTP